MVFIYNCIKWSIVGVLCLWNENVELVRDV